MTDTIESLRAELAETKLTLAHVHKVREATEQEYTALAHQMEEMRAELAAERRKSLESAAEHAGLFYEMQLSEGQLFGRLRAAEVELAAEKERRERAEALDAGSMVEAATADLRAALEAKP